MLTLYLSLSISLFSSLHPPTERAMSGDTKDEELNASTTTSTPSAKGTKKNPWRAAKSAASKTGRLMGLPLPSSKTTNAANAAIAAQVAAALAKEAQVETAKQTLFLSQKEQDQGFMLYLNMIIAYAAAGTLFTIEFIKVALGHPPSQETTKNEEEAFETRRQRAASSVPVEEDEFVYNDYSPETGAGCQADTEKVPVTAISNIISSLKALQDTTKVEKEFKWIDVGRSIRSCEKTMQDLESSTAKASEKNNAAILDEAKSILKTPTFKKYYSRYIAAINSLGSFDGGEELGWKLYSTGKDGTKVSSHYDSEGDLWVKVDGVVQGSASACCAIWKEAHLYNTWFPFCHFSGYLKKYTETEFVVHFGGTTPVGRNDFVVHGYGVNNLEESGKVGFFLSVCFLCYLF
jgi:hypothetical protein